MKQLPKLSWSKTQVFIAVTSLYFNVGITKQIFEYCRHVLYMRWDKDWWQKLLMAIQHQLSRCYILLVQSNISMCVCVYTRVRTCNWVQFFQSELTINLFLILNPPQMHYLLKKLSYRHFSHILNYFECNSSWFFYFLLP